MRVRMLQAVLAALFVAVLPAAAQFDTGRVAGFVRDAGLAVVTGTQDGSERQIRFGVRLGW